MPRKKVNESNIKEPTNMMKHYMATKEQYKDCVLFYRLGDFYELFNDDAVEMSRVLDLTLTGKDCGLDTRAPMCGIPYHAVETYINKLINLGYKIAICEQLSTPQPGKMVERDVVRVITPGTVVDAGVLDETRNNYIASIYQKNNRVGVALCELTTGDFVISDYDGDEYLNNLNDFLVRSLPSEIICISNYELEKMLPCTKLNAMPKFTPYNDDLTQQKSSELLSKYFGIDYESKYDITRMKFGQLAGGLLLSYLEETQKRSLVHINKITKQKSSDFMKIDLNTRKNLEIIETLKDRRKKGALISVIDKTKTTMGSRLMKNWIQEPLYNEREINSRLNAVDELVRKLIARDELKDLLNKITDIERISGRIAYGNFTPRDAVSLGASLKLLPELVNILKQYDNVKIKEFCESMPNFNDITDLLTNAFVAQPPALLSAGGFIKDGFNSELDDYRNAKSKAQDWITQLEAKEREESGIKTLKIGFNRVYGYYIEINKAFSQDVPMRYIRKQTVANCDRYITGELQDLQDKIEHADENSVKLEQNIFKAIREKLLERCTCIQKASKIIAELDCLLSFAEIAVKNNYVKPKVSSKINHILIEAGRHPVVEDLNSSGSFIPNDTLLDEHDNKIMIITGPNMAGKSTYMRQVAIITLLAHIGCFVPAKRAEIALTDRIFTRVGASDDLAVGQSTFMVEMMEVANILENATSKSLVVLDEIGRGTSTYDGLSIAWAVVEEIANNMNCKTMFATHYHELTELEGFMPGVKNYRIAIKEINGQLVFLRKIQRGGANRSYGIEVAELAGVKKSVIVRAKAISNELEKNDLSNHIVKSVSQNPEDTTKKEKSYTNVIAILKDIDINKVTPLGAFETLCDLVQKVKE